MESFLSEIESLWKPHPGQREFLVAPHARKVLACGRRWGKTDACAILLLKALVHPSHPQEKCLVLAPTLDQARLLFDRVENLLRQYQEHKQSVEKISSKRSPYPLLEIEGCRITARSGHRPDSLRGNEATLIIVDEAAFVPSELITEVAMPMLATTEGDLIMISTPNGQNHFWRFFRMGERGEHGIWSKQAPSCDNPMISAEFLATQKELISERAYRVEYEAAFMDSSGRVFSGESIEGCLVPEEKIVSDGPYYIGIDWARYKDYTAIVVLSQHDGKAHLVFAERFTGMVWAAQIEKVAEILTRFPGAKILTDNTGVGDPVLEQLRHAAPHAAIEGLVFNQRVKGDLIDSLRLTVERGQLQMAPNPELLREMENFESRNGKLEAVGGYHDDLVIALALANRILPKQYGFQILLGDIRRFAIRRIIKPLARFRRNG